MKNLGKFLGFTGLACLIGGACASAIMGEPSPIFWLGLGLSAVGLFLSL